MPLFLGGGKFYARLTKAALTTLPTAESLYAIRSSLSKPTFGSSARATVKMKGLAKKREKSEKKNRNDDEKKPFLPIPGLKHFRAPFLHREVAK